MNLKQRKESKVSDLERDFVNQIPDIKEEHLPEVLVGQLARLNKLDELTKDSKRAAKESHEKAIEAKKKAIGWFNKKDRIEDLQEICLDLSEAVQIVTQGQEVAFDHQNQLAQISKYLFGLGTSSISANRTVVRQLELRLKGASEEELSKLARQELTTVVKQLKAQEDVIKKQEKFTKRLNRQDLDITELFDKNTEFKEKIDLQSDKIKAEIKEVNENILWSEKEFGNRIEKLNDNFNLEITGSNFKILKIEEEIKLVARTTNIKAEKIKGDLNSEVESLKVSMKENDIFYKEVLDSQKIKINLLTAFLIINILLITILIFNNLKP